MIFEIIDQFKSGFKKIDLFEFELLTFTLKERIHESYSSGQIKADIRDFYI